MTALGRPLLRPGSVVGLVSLAAVLLVALTTTGTELVILLGYVLLGGIAGYSLSGSI